VQDAEHRQTAEELYHRMASLSGGDWLEKKDLYGAHPGDDTDLDSGFHGHAVIMLEEFVGSANE